MTFTKSLLITILFLSLCAIVKADEPLQIAQSQIGLGEEGGNNRGQYVKKYLNGQEGLPWCAGFVSYCLKQAGYTFPYYLMAKSYLKIGMQIDTPQSGDLAIFTRKGGGHIGIVERVEKGRIVIIEGNVDEYPAYV